MVHIEQVYYNIEEFCFHEEALDVEIFTAAGEMGQNEDDLSLYLTIIFKQHFKEPIHRFLVLDNLHDLILITQGQIRVDPACIFSDFLFLAP